MVPDCDIQSQSRILHSEPSHTDHKRVRKTLKFMTFTQTNNSLCCHCVHEIHVFIFTKSSTDGLQNSGLLRNNLIKSEAKTLSITFSTVIFFYFSIIFFFYNFYKAVCLCESAGATIIPPYCVMWQPPRFGSHHSVWHSSIGRINYLLFTVRCCLLLLKSHPHYYASRNYDHKILNISFAFLVLFFFFSLCYSLHFVSVRCVESCKLLCQLVQ